MNAGFSRREKALHLEDPAMIPNANRTLFRLKAAQRDLISACGGIERAAEICAYSKSTVGRWNADGPELMPLDAVMALEAECGRAEVTLAMAGLHGLRLAGEPEAAGVNECLMARHADTVTRAAELMTEGALAFSDAKVTPAEAARMDRAASALAAAVEEYRKTLASVRAEGGATLQVVA